MKRFFLIAVSGIGSAFGLEPKNKMPEPLLEHKYVSQDVSQGIKAYQKYKETKPSYSLSVDQLVSAFPYMFAHIPKELHHVLSDYVPYAYPDSNTLPDELIRLVSSEFSLRIFKWTALGYFFGLMPFYNFDQGYFYFEQPNPKNENSVLKGVRDDKTVKAVHDLDQLIQKLSYSRDAKKDELISQAKKEREEVIQSLVAEYKIHLMPLGDPTLAVVTLLNLLKKDSELQQLIAAFKVMASDKFVVNGIYYPRMVIYPAKGKDNGQKALNKLYAELKDIPGLGMKPLFNAKVTDLIWIAQGDSYYKKNSAYKVYFEQPKMIYYRKDLTGKDEQYHLVHPETGKEIV